jgi:hypothetical protein
VTTVNVSWADRFNFVPLDMPRHQTMVQDSLPIDREDDRVDGGASAETMYQKGNAEQPYEAKPPHERRRHGENGCRYHCRTAKNKAGISDLGVAPS